MISRYILGGSDEGEVWLACNDCHPIWEIEVRFGTTLADVTHLAQTHEDAVHRVEPAGYDALVRYWVNTGATEAEARAAARKVYP